jgi:hypothetical protein
MRIPLYPALYMRKVSPLILLALKAPTHSLTSMAMLLLKQGARPPEVIMATFTCLPARENSDGVLMVVVVDVDLVWIVAERSSRSMVTATWWKRGSLVFMSDADAADAARDPSDHAFESNGW